MGCPTSKVVRVDINTPRPALSTGRSEVQSKQATPTNNSYISPSPQKRLTIAAPSNAISSNLMSRISEKGESTALRQAAQTINAQALSAGVGATGAAIATDDDIRQPSSKRFNWTVFSRPESQVSKPPSIVEAHKSPETASRRTVSPSPVMVVE